jgi:AcrR family transcriptional regulator
MARKDDKTATIHPRDAIVAAAMALAAERAWEHVDIRDIAERAGVSLADFRDCFPSKMAVLGGFIRMIDRQVLSAATDDMAGEPAKERLFDVLMRRIDALSPYKEALRAILPVLRRDPLSLAAMNQAAMNSHRFMLAAAGIDTHGPLVTVKLQGLVIAFARVIDVWLDDHEPDMSKTMAALDRELTRGGAILERFDDLHRLTAPLRAFCDALSDGGKRFRERMRERAESGKERPAENEDMVAI